jgi:NDP-sugar pyrophosphorylase family protein
MKAFILAAGMGTRLKPATDTLPKALFPVNGHPLLEIIIRRLAGAGFRDLVINVHHLAGQVVGFLNDHDGFGLNISISDESGQLLDTGGALKKAAPLLYDGDPVLVHNVDILSNIDYRSLMEFHEERKPVATLATKDRPTTRNLLVDREGLLCGWEFPDRNLSILTRDSRKGLRATAFSGVYVVSPGLFDKFPEEEVFGFMPWILDLAAKEKIMAWDQGDTFWYEAGRNESVAIAARSLSFDPEDPVYIRENR